MSASLTTRDIPDCTHHNINAQNQSNHDDQLELVWSSALESSDVARWGACRQEAGSYHDLRPSIVLWMKTHSTPQQYRYRTVIVSFRAPNHLSGTFILSISFKFVRHGARRSRSPHDEHKTSNQIQHHRRCKRSLGHSWECESRTRWWNSW